MTESLGWLYTSSWRRKMKKLVTLCTVTLTAVLLVAPVVGCQQPPQPSATPSLAIMIESNIAEAGSSFMVSGLNVKPNQKIWIEGDYSLSDGVKSGYSLCITDEEGLIYPIIDVPEDTVPGDYEVEIYIGKHLDDRELITTLPIRVQAEAK